MKNFVSFFVISILFFCWVSFDSWFFGESAGFTTLRDSGVLKNGDIILRRDNGKLSEIFAELSKSKYSHSGIVLKNGKDIKIAHMEGLDYGDKRKNCDLKLVSLKSFLAYANSYAVYRPNYEVNATSLKNYVLELDRKNIKFDSSFGMSTRKRNTLYCSEFVYLANKVSTNVDIEPQKTKGAVSVMGNVLYSYYPVSIFENNHYFTLFYKEKLNNNRESKATSPLPDKIFFKVY